MWLALCDDRQVSRSWAAGWMVLSSPWDRKHGRRDMFGGKSEFHLYLTSLRWLWGIPVELSRWHVRSSCCVSRIQYVITLTHLFQVMLWNSLIAVFLLHLTVSSQRAGSDSPSHAPELARCLVDGRSSRHVPFILFPVGIKCCHLYAISDKTFSKFDVHFLQLLASSWILTMMVCG